MLRFHNKSEKTGFKFLMHATECARIKKYILKNIINDKATENPVEKVT